MIGVRNWFNAVAWILACRSKHGPFPCRIARINSKQTGGTGSRPMDNCDYDLWSISGPPSIMLHYGTRDHKVTRTCNFQCFALIRLIFGDPWLLDGEDRRWWPEDLVGKDGIKNNRRQFLYSFARRDFVKFGYFKVHLEYTFDILKFILNFGNFELFQIRRFLDQDPMFHSMLIRYLVLGTSFEGDKLYIYSEILQNLRVRDFKVHLE